MGGELRIPHNRLVFGVEEERAVVRVLRSAHLAQGLEVKKFEDECCDFLQIPRGSAVALSSGTAALFLALLALQAQGKHVAIPQFTCSALRNAVTLAGGKPIYMDSLETTPNMDLCQLDDKEEIIIAPHMYGIPQDLSLWKEKKVIEDCAQSLGASVQGKPVGLQGDVGVYSFYATKLITSGGQGGMVVSKNPAIIDFIRDYREFDGRKDKKSRFNFQMTDVEAAIGRVQLKNLPTYLERRESIFNQYKEAGFPLVDANEGMVPVRYRALIQTNKQKKLLQALEKEHIIAKIPIQKEELHGKKSQYERAFYWSEHLISLPIYPSLSDREVEKIIQVVSQHL